MRPHTACGWRFRTPGWATPCWRAACARHNNAACACSGAAKPANHPPGNCKACFTKPCAASPHMKRWPPCAQRCNARTTAATPTATGPLPSCPAHVRRPGQPSPGGTCPGPTSRMGRGWLAHRGNALRLPLQTNPARTPAAAGLVHAIDADESLEALEHRMGNEPLLTYRFLALRQFRRTVIAHRDRQRSPRPHDAGLQPPARLAHGANAPRQRRCQPAAHPCCHRAARPHHGAAGRCRH